MARELVYYIGISIDGRIAGPGGEYEFFPMGGITSPYAHLRQYVVSSTTDPGTDPAVTIVPGDPVGLVRRLKAEDGLDIWLCGGGRLAGAVFGEIDRLVVKRYPVVVGDGIPAFERGFGPVPFRVTRRRAFDNGVEITWFSRG